MTANFNPENFYRTSDMSMATFLRMNDHAVQDTVLDDPTCYWVFRATKSLIQLTDDYTGGKARVDPRKYNKEFARTKNEFHALSRNR